MDTEAISALSEKMHQDALTFPNGVDESYFQMFCSFQMFCVQMDALINSFNSVITKTK